MTESECEIVANAGVQLREIAERLTMPASYLYSEARVIELVTRMDAAALSISEVYGQLSALPLEVESEGPSRKPIFGSNTILTVRREIQEKAGEPHEPVSRSLDIATTHLAWVLQQFPEVADAYDRAWRESA